MCHFARNLVSHYLIMAVLCDAVDGQNAPPEAVFEGNRELPEDTQPGKTERHN